MDLSFDSSYHLPCIWQLSGNRPHSSQTRLCGQMTKPGSCTWQTTQKPTSTSSSSRNLVCTDIDTKTLQVKESKGTRTLRSSSSTFLLESSSKLQNQMKLSTLARFG